MLKSTSPSLSRSIKISAGPRTVVTPVLQAGRSRPKTAANSTGYLDEIICTISEAGGTSPTVGLSFVNISTCEAVLCQISDTQTFARTCHKIRVFSPTEILFAESTSNSKLVSILRDNLDTHVRGISMSAIHCKYWAEDIGYQYLQRLAFPDDIEALKLSISGSYYAMCCFAAAITSIDLYLDVKFAPCTLRIKFEPSEGAVLIDLSTISSLELLQNSCNAKSKTCLFGLLSRTQTVMGKRILKSNILQPSTDHNKILARHEAVTELRNHDTLLHTVREALKISIDTDKVLARLVIIRQKYSFDIIEQSVNNILMLKNFVDLIDPIWRALDDVQSDELRTIRELCDSENYIEVRESLRFTINEDVRYSSKPTELRNQRVFAIKAGINGFLDVARTTFQESTNNVITLVEQLKGPRLYLFPARRRGSQILIVKLLDEYQLPLSLAFEPARQYYLKIKAVELGNRQLPPVFINVYRTRGRVECQTMDLIKMNSRIRDAHNEIVNMSDAGIQKLIEQLRGKIHPLFKISESIAVLDMLSSFAHLAKAHNYVRPEILSTLAVKNGRHPILEHIQTRTRHIPNDVYATQQQRFQIITGCNMSGKSTYIRSVALMAVMAQIGCFVPADYASFPITHQIFARVSTDDNVEANVSSFASEMREMAFILHNVEPRSLVIVDELGRGTSTTDGLSIAIAISEALIESKALVWFVTHFRDLPRVLAERAGVVNLHLTVDLEADLSCMKMMYKIAAGHEEQKFYGLALARLMDLPPRVIECATNVSTYLNERNDAKKGNVRTLAVAKRRKLVLKLREQLEQAKESEMERDQLLSWLKRLQEEFVLRMAAIDADLEAAEAEICMMGTVGDLNGCTKVVEPVSAINTDGYRHGTPLDVIHHKSCKKKRTKTSNQYNDDTGSPSEADTDELLEISAEQYVNNGARPLTATSSSFSETEPDDQNLQRNLHPHHSSLTVSQNTSYHHPDLFDCGSFDSKSSLLYDVSEDVDDEAAADDSLVNMGAAVE